MQRLLTKANNEASVWRQKFESGEGSIRTEELDDLKRKFLAKLQEAEAAVDAAQSKTSSLEKAKNRLQGELEDLMIEVSTMGFTVLLYFLDCVESKLALLCSIV